MPNETPDVSVLTRGLDQVAAMLDGLAEDDLVRPTPCPDWTVTQLVDHVVGTTETFVRAVRGDEVDWTAPRPDVGAAKAAAFRSAADDLLEAWTTQGVNELGPEGQCAELAVHTYDLATALDRPTSALDPEVAETGLAFMRANLRPELRGEAFGPEQPAPDGADAYQRIAAFAGRRV